ncbi:type VII secretion protein EccCa [Streptomyces sp. NPDC051987]|uniref:type VII secretion protein EccCa n=1 Tax=Streptomyces sp. NPDC051987 TaxID=3155808 RepID=UPI0034265E47
MFRRPPRRPGPEPPRGELLLAAPPDLPEHQGGNFGQLLTYLPMALGGGAMAFMYVGVGGSAVTYLVGGMFALSSVGMMFGQLGRGSGDRRRRIDGERRDYLRYLGQVRRRARTAARRQREALSWNHPEPDALWSLAMTSRRWERRAGDADFGVVRIATGPQRLSLRLIPPDTKPAEDLDIVAAPALRSLIRAHADVPALPISVALRTYSRVDLDGDEQTVRGLVRATLCQLATFHAPEDLRVAVCASPARLAEWAWLKWLPHAHHPRASDAAGPVRLISEDMGDLEDLMGAELAERPRFKPGGPGGGSHLIVVIDGGFVPYDAQLAVGDAQGVTVVDLSRAVGHDTDRNLLRLSAEPDELFMIGKDPQGRDSRRTVGRPDTLGPAQAEALARVLAPYRTGEDAQAPRPLEAQYDLPTLLGIADVEQLDLELGWQRRAVRDRLRIPIGVDPTGTPVELDLKEAAQAGMGPHGLIIGATGSGKSELLRTLVTGLALTHSSEELNFVLADFKGGATFLGLEELPHTSAVITNLAEELPLVDRMQDALRGELVRRQELLRAAGNLTSIHDYERLRQRDGEAGTLTPLPTLLVIVDEFSELLAVRPEFAELFVMIGRLGRSLGVHLLLASQRLEEGRLRGLETHLSYRICLRTFSAMESRIVLGVADAHELPGEPGNGYLKVDVHSMIRFKAAYVSGAYRRAQHGAVPAALVQQIVPYTAEPVPVQVPDQPAAAEPDGAATVQTMEVVVGRLRGAGPAAHQVWLPPLGESLTVDSLLGPLAEDPEHGLRAFAWPGCGALAAPLGVIDRPFEQRRDLLVADLSGSAGHVGVVGASQSGKSTLIRTLITSFALTHTPQEAQFYCLDFGGGTLAPLAGLPHVGGVATRLQADVVRRTVAELTSLLEAREASFALHQIDSMAAYREARRTGQVTGDRFGDVFLVVDGWTTVRQEFDSLEGPITTLAGRGLAYGIHVVVATNRWADFRPALRDLLGTRLELRLGEPFESEVNRRAAENVPLNTPGWGLDRQGSHFMTALPRIDGLATADGLVDGVRGLVSALDTAWSGPKAPSVRLLPAELPHARLLGMVPPELTGIPYAVAEDDLAPVYTEFDAEPHFLVFGDSASGKSNLLRVLATGIATTYTPEQARLVVVDYRRTLLGAITTDHLIGYAHSADLARSTLSALATAMRERLPGPDVTPAELRDRSWWSGADLYLVVDDYDVVGTRESNPLFPLLELLPHSRDIGFHLILARASGGAGRGLMTDPVLQRVREYGAPGILLSGSKDEGNLLGDAKPVRLPPGRGLLVGRRGGSRLVQTAYLPPP